MSAPSFILIIVSSPKFFLYELRQKPIRHLLS
jgi:hypothetical protein